MTYLASPHRYEEMQYRTCGRSGLKLPAMSLGLWHSFGDTTDLAAQRDMLRTAFDLGITHFDRPTTTGRRTVRPNRISAPCSSPTSSRTAMS